jgi:large subunit ribosomal protein L17
MMIRNLLTSLIIFEKLHTTEAKAKEVKSSIDQIINTAKKNDLSARRKLHGILLHKNAVDKLFNEIITRYTDRNSGYTRSYHMNPRLGDGSKMMLLELIGSKDATGKTAQLNEPIKIDKKIKNEKTVIKTARKKDGK